MTIFHKLLAFLAATLSLAASAGTITYFHNDLAGSPMVATNASGQVIWREDYRPYGERLLNTLAVCESATNPLPEACKNKTWFTSRRQDPETGLVYMGARFYDPVAGRFISQDPVHFVEDNVHSFNRYAYANNNPYKFKDPTGNVAESVWDLASFALSVAILRGDPNLSNFAGAALDGVALAIPFVPGGIGTMRTVGGEAMDAATKALRDGQSLPTSAALDAASSHLGAGYKEVAPGVFKSSDGTRMVRMTDSDLAKVGNHAGAPHLNIETGYTVTKPNGKESFISRDNKHIFLPQER